MAFAALTPEMQMAAAELGLFGQRLSRLQLRRASSIVQLATAAAASVSIAGCKCANNNPGQRPGYTVGGSTDDGSSYHADP